MSFHRLDRERFGGREANAARRRGRNRTAGRNADGCIKPQGDTRERERIRDQGSRCSLASLGEGEGMVGGGGAGVLGADGEGGPAAGIAVILLEELTAGASSVVLVVAVEGRGAHQNNIAADQRSPGVHHQGRIADRKGNGTGCGVVCGGARANNFPLI